MTHAHMHLFKYVIMSIVIVKSQVLREKKRKLARNGNFVADKIKHGNRK